jgi:lactoylglutathione lyase
MPSNGNDKRFPAQRDVIGGEMADYDPANPPLLQPDAPVPAQGFVVATLLIVQDVARSREYYARIFEAKVIEDDEPSILRLANTWLIINSGGGPTDDKPTVVAAPPADPDRLGVAMNFRVADVRACYELWRSRGAQFLTAPKVHADEIRCYIRDPDGYLIEVGQTTS